MTDRDGLATSFGAVAGAYDTARPAYPSESVAWLVDGVDGPVVDVGAGTGKLTRALVGLGHDVIAVEPDPAMLAVLSAASPDVAAHVGHGESIPLGDASAGAVVFGQAWHWVDVEVASVEAARVLRPGGVLGLIWNIRDESVDWIRALGDIMHGSAAERLLASDDGPQVGAPFDRPEHHAHRWSQPMTRETLVRLVESRSYVITAAADERRAILDAVGDLLDAQPDLAAGGTIAMDYVTHSYRARRP